MPSQNDPKKGPPTPKSQSAQNEGEGSRSGARQYDAGAEKAAKDAAHIKKAATEAEKALDGPEANELKEAEKRGKNNEHR